MIKIQPYLFLDILSDVHQDSGTTGVHGPHAKNFAFCSWNSWDLL